MREIIVDYEIMNVRELAAYLRCHQSTIYRLLRAGKLPAFRVGSDWRFNRDRIDTWCLEQGENRGNEKVS